MALVTPQIRNETQSHMRFISIITENINKSYNCYTKKTYFYRLRTQADNMYARKTRVAVIYCCYIHSTNKDKIQRNI